MLRSETSPQNLVAALSATGSQGLWILCDARAETVVASQSWEDADATGLSSRIARTFSQLLEAAGASPTNLHKVFCVSGPGAFTGLRMSSAFAQGLARSLKIPVIPIPTFDLVGEPFSIPLRHQKARALDLPAALAQGLEFLNIRGPQDFNVQIPTGDTRVVGLNSQPHWPQPEELRRGVVRNLDSQQKFTLNYGLEPKISGVRGA